MKALQEVMASENLPPPPTHLLEVSEHLEVLFEMVVKLCVCLTVLSVVHSK